MTDRKNAKHFQARHGIKNLVVATNLIVETFLPFLPAFRPSLRATIGTLAIATVKAANKMLLAEIVVHGCSPFSAPELSMSASADTIRIRKRVHVAKGRKQSYSK
jgi:hypothetical protein